MKSKLSVKDYAQVWKENRAAAKGGRKEGEKGVRANTNGDRLGSLNRTGAKGLLLRGREGGRRRGLSVGR